MVSDRESQEGVNLALTEVKPHAVRRSHDFGFVKPSASLQTSFTVPNNTSRQWTLAEIIKPCSCTVAEVRSPAVPPGSAFEFSVLYSTGSRMANEHRTLQIRFKEPAAPIIFVDLRAHVRPETVASVPELNVMAHDRVDKLTSSFLVSNYSDTKWRGIRVHHDVSWLSVIAKEVPVHSISEEDGCKQVWKVDATFSTAETDLGSHFAVLHVGPTEPRSAEQAIDIPVTLERVRDASAQPTKLFLGRIRTGEQVHKVIRLRASIPFTSDAKHQVRVEGGRSFKADITRIQQLNSHEILLALSCTPSSVSDGLVTDAVTFNWTRDRVQSTVQLPLVAILHLEQP
jgi:hypothetical protein